MKSFLLILLSVVVFFANPLLAGPPPTDLYLHGFSLIPAPQKVQLRSQEVAFDATWACEVRQLSASHVAVRTLMRDLAELHGITLKMAGVSDKKRVVLKVASGTVAAGSDPEVSKQAYRLDIAPGLIEVTGNSDQGLFYGIQTLLQLLKPGPGGNELLPSATIEDWPTYKLRFLHWDTKHHQERIETLKRYLDWSARFKVNMIGFELEDKFEYPSHPIIGAPGAYTSAELQEIVNYGLERYIQVVPQIQSPAHMAYVLKHPEFADLRADGNNYQACTCDPRAYDLIFSMYDDVIKATRGVEYFHVSTDEVYYAGICSKCDKPYNPENRSLRWVEFVQRAHDFLAQRNRKMLAWVEYPFLVEHTSLLPPDLIDGVLGTDAAEIKAEIEHGVRHLAYTSLQGEELLFPDHFTTLAKDRVRTGRLESVYQEISLRARPANPVGVYGAAWDDSGLHSETFWLGWATVAQYGWNPGAAPVEQTAAEFMNIYYGRDAGSLMEIYRKLQNQARYFQGSWDRVVSRVRGPGYGNSYGKGIGTTRYDQTLPQPPLPLLPGLDFVPVYRENYQGRLQEAAQRALENDVLVHELLQAIPGVTRNRYNLEVFLSLARLTGHQNRVLLGMREIEEQLESARQAALRGNSKNAARSLAGAYGIAGTIIEERKSTFAELQKVWEKSRFPKGREVNGKKFIHVLDDVKDHWADRRADLSYMIAPEESIGLEKWREDLRTLVTAYQKQNQLPESRLEDLLVEEEE